MADFVSALHGWITTAPTVSPDLGTRLYPRDKVPQNAVSPYGMYQVISDPRPEHLKGYDRARQSRVQIWIVAATYGAARSISEKIIAAVSVPGIHGGIKFGRVKAEGPRDLSQDTSSGTVSMASTDLLVEHKSA